MSDTGGAYYGPTSPGTASTPDYARAEAGAEDQSLGEIVSRISDDLSRLMRQELQLAKVETTQEAKKAGLAAGMFGGAALAGWMTALFVSMTVMWALSHAMDLAWAALIVTAIWAVIGAVLFSAGRKKMAQVNPKPEQTIETLQEDKQWLKAQKS